MQRLRDKRPIPGSVEQILVELIKACGPHETSPTARRRVYTRVLDVVLGRRPKVSSRSRLWPKIGISLLLLAGLLAPAAAAAAPRPLIDYFQPMPVVGKLSTTVWGGATVGPRDPANGLEDNGSSGGVGPGQETNYYWDGKILKGDDGKYHLYASRWLHSNGFGPPAGGPSGSGWESSIPIQAVSNNVMGPYVVQGNCYSANQEGNDMGHNTTALLTPTGASPYTLSVGEIVPGQMFSASSANGPWTPLGLTQTSSNGHTACGDLSSNFTFTVGPNNRFWATSRGGCVMDSAQVLGSYKVETDSVLPNLEHNDNGDAEDEVIWYSGGYFHIVYNYWNVQRAYHIMSKDGITGWASTGLAYQGVQSPANANSNWLRYTDGTVNQWHNMERPGVYQENGHVTHFTFAVTDVDKNSSAVNSGGSKVLIVPFNGVQFDCDNGDAASCSELGVGGAGGSGTGGGGSAGRSGVAGGGGAAGSVGGNRGTGGSGTGGGGVGGSGEIGGGAGGLGAAGGGAGVAGASGSGGLASAGGSDGDAGTGRSTGGSAGGRVGTGGASTPGGGMSGATAGVGGRAVGAASASGCGCGLAAEDGQRGPATLLLLLAGVVGVVSRRRRR
jgi:hypothetical protein